MTIMIAKNIGMALHTMRSSRARTALTMLGVVIAVAAVTTVVSIGNGIQASLSKQANQYSKNVVTVRPEHLAGSQGPLSSITSATAVTSLTQKDATAIAKVPGVASSVPLTIVGTAAQADGNFKGVVFSASSELPSVLNQELEYGAFYTEGETSNNVAVLGANAADQLFDQSVPLGRTFSVRGEKFIVSGVLSKFTSTPFTNDSNFNNAIFVPEAATKSLAPSGAPIYEILAKVSEGKEIADIDKAITKALAKNHGTNDDVSVLTPAQLASETTATFDLLADLIVAAAIITLLVSGVGIMNVMLVSVTERIHEIGIRKAVGATNRQILGQFVTEAATLCVVGSAIGAVVAFLVVICLSLFTSLTPQYDWQTAGISCLIACGFGILFGTLPAIKAARKDPIAALRSE